MWVQSLGQEHPLEEGMATHSSILAWEISWTEDPGGLRFTNSMDVSLGELRELVMDREACCCCHCCC